MDRRGFLGIVGSILVAAKVPLVAAPVFKKNEPITVDHLYMTDRYGGLRRLVRVSGPAYCGDLMAWTGPNEVSRHRYDSPLAGVMSSQAAQPGWGWMLIHGRGPVNAISSH